MSRAGVLRLGMVGGGPGAFIGGVHRMAARLDGRWSLVAGAFSSDPAVSAEFGASLGLSPERAYGDWAEMARAEAGRQDGIDAVAVVTPNHLHAQICAAFLAAGVPVICDKPLTIDLTSAKALAEQVAASGLPFVLTHNYSGYPMVREARALVAAGRLGPLRVVQVEYAQDWLARALPGNRQADWRGDPARAGPGGALGDIATHAFHLTRFVTGQAVAALSADLSTFVPGRRVDDNVHVQLRFEGGARGQLWASQVAVGAANGLRLRVFGEDAGLEWSQEEPDVLRFTALGEAPRSLRRGGPGLSDEAQAATRLPAGHPEGYLEGFAQIYADAAELVAAHHETRAPDALARLAPGIDDGVEGVAFIEAVLKSHAAGGAWTGISA
ncbi:Gfo/Idh/MocA family protein [Phenylobacterium sp.]|uniref:Gfo/Idh/MocA family protein n=1 Tax=Phenylobacterium sp. TaxID=1871053 RepID=UPI002730F5AD|nr:Gfo/Idh/MocA family oxidoreductase [Phenylobacterium sp.]MDP1873975.1 Gfo/Idh/MocA family oxidoreductase [Phenylobacterium sp.]